MALMIIVLVTTIIPLIFIWLILKKYSCKYSLRYKFDNYVLNSHNKSAMQILHEFPIVFKEDIETYDKNNSSKKFKQRISFKEPPRYVNAITEEYSWMTDASTIKSVEFNEISIASPFSENTIESSVTSNNDFFKTNNNINKFILDIKNKFIKDFLSEQLVIAIQDIHSRKYSHWYAPMTNVTGYIQIKPNATRPIATRPIAKLEFGATMIHRKFATDLHNCNIIHSIIQKFGNNGLHEAISVLSGVVTANKNDGMGRNYIAFLDVSNAYGSVNHKLLNETLKFHKISASIAEYIIWFYENTMITFKGDGNRGNQKTIRWLNGIYQGDPLANILFLLVMQYITIQILNERPHLKYTLLKYVDDIVLWGKYKTPTKSFDDVDFIEATYQKYGFTMNNVKRRIVIFSPTRNDAKIIDGAIDYRHMCMSSEIIDIKYLGSYIFMPESEIVNKIGISITNVLQKLDMQKTPFWSKLKTYRLTVSTFIRWHFMVNIRERVGRSKIEEIETKFLIKWQMLDYMVHFRKREQSIKIQYNGMILDSTDVRINELTTSLNLDGLSKEDYIKKFKRHIASLKTNKKFNYPPP